MLPRYRNSVLLTYFYIDVPPPQKKNTPKNNSRNKERMTENKEKKFRIQLIILFLDFL